MIAILAIQLAHGGDVLAVAAGPVGNWAVCGGGSRVIYFCGEVNCWLVHAWELGGSEREVEVVWEHGVLSESF